MPDGQPQTQIMWVHADDDHVLINTEVGRQKFRNVRARPPGHGHRLRRRQRLPVRRGPWPRGRDDDGDPARADIDELSQKYMGTPYPGDIGPGGRVILRIAVDKIHKNNL